MSNDASTNQEFYARLGIEPAPKARGIREVMAENVQRAKDAQAMLSRIDAAAIKTTAKSFLS